MKSNLDKTIISQSNKYTEVELLKLQVLRKTLERSGDIG